jgi:formylglycine-generating enzyme required for sulfatase activity
VTLEPFFLSKYEMTQGQWVRFNKENPSHYNPEYSTPIWNRKGDPVSLLHPVDSVSWEDCVRILSRLKLRLPTESDWEYAARAGTTTVWWTGNEKSSLDGAANICDLYCKDHGGKPEWIFDEWLNDGYTVHAPVGSFLANAFGLHDVHGNVWEWCQDSYGNYDRTPSDGSAFESGDASVRIVRGGSWCFLAERCRSALRFKIAPGVRNDFVGLRPAASLQ